MDSFSPDTLETRRRQSRLHAAGKASIDHKLNVVRRVGKIGRVEELESQTLLSTTGGNKAKAKLFPSIALRRAVKWKATVNELPCQGST